MQRVPYGSILRERRVLLARRGMLLVAACLAAGGLLRAAEGVRSLETLVAEATERVYPSLLYIEPVTEDFSGGRREKRLSSGSGVIISARGEALTNYHVAGHARFLLCTLSNKEEVEATFVGGDPQTDIALIQLDEEAFRKAVGPDFRPARLGRSASLRLGQHVLAMGSPFGYDRSVSLGIVSCLDRFLPGGARLPTGEQTGEYNTWIQTDAAINPGNSGGPLVDLGGEVVGINARVVAFGNSIGFAIPVDTVKEVAASLREYGRVRRSWLGLTLQPTSEIEAELGRLPGVLVSGVVAGSPAAKAGLTAGELLLSANGTPLSARHRSAIPAVRRRLASLPVGEEARLLVQPLLQEGGVREVTLLSEERDESLGRVLEIAPWGITVQALSEETARQLQLPAARGVLLYGVQPGSPAARAGLQPDDVVVAVEGAEADDLTIFVALVARLHAKETEAVAVTLRRGRTLRYGLVRPRYRGGEAEQDAEENEDATWDGAPPEGME